MPSQFFKKNLSDLFRIEKIGKKDSRRIRLILFSFVLVAFLSWLAAPMKVIHSLFPESFLFNGKETSCILLNLTGIPCPFCGMSRSFTSLLHLNFLQSFYFNPSSVIFFTFLTFFILTIFTLSLKDLRLSIINTRKAALLGTTFIALIWIINILFGHH